jgi:hypothetical protein
MNPPVVLRVTSTGVSARVVAVLGSAVGGETEAATLGVAAACPVDR